MASGNELKFPTFECIISKTQEEPDSDVEYFFLHKNHLSAQLAKLRLLDGRWSENYEKMMKYLYDLSESLVEMKEPPSYQFLVDLSMGDETEDDTTLRLLKSENPLVPDLVSASTRVREIMYWFVKNYRDPKFSKSFTPERFQGLPFLRLALVYRSVNLADR